MKISEAKKFKDLGYVDQRIITGKTYAYLRANAGRPVSNKELSEKFGIQIELADDLSRIILKAEKHRYEIEKRKQEETIVK